MRLLIVSIFVVFSVGSSSAWTSFFNLQSALQKGDELINSKNSAYKDVLAETQKHLNAMEDEVKQIREVVPDFADNAFGNMAKGIYEKAKGVGNKAIDSAKKVVDKVSETSINMLSYVTKAYLNNGADFLLMQLRAGLRTFNFATVPIPEVKLTVSSAWTFGYGVEFIANQGYFSNLTTLSRDGEVDFDVFDEGMVIHIPMTLGQLYLGYDHFQIPGVTGSISASVESNKVDIKLRLSLVAGCALNVEKVNLTELKGLKLRFGNMGTGSEYLMSYVIDPLTKMLEGVIKSNVQSAIDNAITSYLESNPVICSKFIPCAHPAPA